MNTNLKNHSLPVPLWIIVLLAAVMTGAGCGSSGEILNIGAEERFAIGKKLFDEEDYFEAIAEFEILKLQFPGSAVADDAQFYMGESHFNRGEYLLAIEEFRTLKRNMASSPLLPAAQYRTGLSYYMLSPRPDLDQTYTRQAIDEFQAFVEYYPLDEHRNDAEEKIRELNGRLAEKLFQSGEQYVKLGYHRSAGFYFDLVIQQYHDSPFAEPAYVGKIRSLITRRRTDEAREEISKFLERYPQSTLKGQVEGLRPD
ncbi:MAG TPA: outer membrane protein assembly factor BamD [Bacteroidota bacterium]|nr:outer membrane protein assembly factor BamD [Bacteroidota bacterium]